jgi:hypothetical protein
LYNPQLEFSLDHQRQVGAAALLQERKTMLPKEVIRLMKRTVAKTLRKLKSSSGLTGRPSHGRSKGKKGGCRAEPRRDAK